MSKTPYQVLGITPDAGDEEVKQAYRALARKYHPDRYTNTDLADLANEKMQEVNAAYEEIQRMRAESAKAEAATESRAHSGYREADPRRDWEDDGEGPGNYNKQNYSAEAREKFILIRHCINSGNITEAERLLGEVEAEDRGAEWFFLLGCVQLRKGYYVDAQHSFDTAYGMEPGNNEYWQFKEKMHERSRRFSQGSSTSGNGGCCSTCYSILCADCCCECLGGDLIPFC